MYQDIFEQIGFNKNEAIVYDFLLQHGAVPAGEIIKKTPLKRGVVYNVLNDLTKKGLVAEKKKNKKTIFSPLHPEKLRDYVLEKEKAVQSAKNALEANLPDIVSGFNLISGQPGVRYFEGINGIKKVLDDTLINNKNKKILTFSDVAGYATFLKKWNTDYYAPKRRKLNIYEKVIIPDNKKALDYMKDYIKNHKSDKLTDILFINHKLYPFKTEVNIYNNKVSFVTFSKKIHIGVIIENKEIHDSLSSVFNFAWDMGSKK